MKLKTMVVIVMMMVMVMGVKVTAQEIPLTIINGTNAVLSGGQDSFLYCFAGDGSEWGPWWAERDMSVMWTDPRGRSVPGWTGGARVWTAVQPGAGVPHAYLVMRGFRPGLAGRYTCSLRAGHRILAAEAITLWYFRPSFRILPLPKCLAVRRGGTVLLPFPVVGDPPRPPQWLRLDGRLDPSATTLLPGGLLLSHVTGAGMYRVKVPVGGGLSFTQDVLVTTSPPPTTCPRHDVTYANHLIHDIQISAFRSRLARLSGRGGGDG